MHITQDDSKILRVEEKNTTIILLAAVVATFALVRTGFLIYSVGPAYEHYLHWVFIAALAAFAGNSFAEEVSFIFDRTNKVMSWSRKKLFRDKEEGRLPFSAIQDVRIGYRGTGKLAKYRIELVVEGQSFPLSRIYFQGMRAKDTCDRIAQRILETLPRG
ncbi:hypothetical protein DSLASN_46180 [Desulfoluna limicola]|uniref:DUF304 domain-containing protein n=1 Tax=Desulfoluna limicola TaxID=2810562 RepID=A0ABM7PNX4_9BACT|nr:hypothetical protein [Desulfoluna limicola]BCS98986.1 hypothetical protein DSLASN_46180 [Desulfoluna limicola]